MNPIRNIQTAFILIILVGMALPVAVSPLHAQDDGYFFIQRPKLGLGAYCRLRDEKRETFGDKNQYKDRKFRESLTLETNGWVYHPNLMEYRLFLEPTWQQETFRRTPTATNADPNNDEDTSLLAYDVEATLLKRKPVSLNLFADRNTGEIDYTNAPDADIERQSLGTRLNFASKTLPASIACIHRELDETGFYRTEEDRDEARLNIGHNAKKSVTQLNMRYDNTDRTTRTTFDATDMVSETLSTELSNVYYITDGDKIRLNSQLYNMQADYNDLDQSTWLISENLFWTHSKNLLTRYRADYNRREFGGSVNEEKRIGADLTHLLNDRLTTDVGVAAIINDFAGGSEDLYQSTLSLLYRRPIPWGSVELGAAYDYGITRRDGYQETIPTDERLTLSISSETFLDKENILLESIVVTDLTGTVVYTESIDYRIETVGPMVRISRTLLGAITDGQQVIAHYSYRVDTGYDDSRFGQKYQFSLALWSYLTLAYSHRRIDQTILSGEPTGDPLDDTSNTVRLSFVTKWSDTELLYDQQDRSNGNSSTTRSINQRFNFKFARTFYLTLFGNIGDREFPDFDDDEQFYSVGSSVSWMPRQWCHFSLNYLRNSISGDRRDELDSEVATSIKLRYGIWTGDFTYRLRDQNDKQYGDSLWRQEMIFTLTRHLW